MKNQEATFCHTLIKQITYNERSKVNTLTKKIKVRRVLKKYLPK